MALSAQPEAASLLPPDPETFRPPLQTAGQHKPSRAPIIWTVQTACEAAMINI